MEIQPDLTKLASLYFLVGRRTSEASRSGRRAGLLFNTYQQRSPMWEAPETFKIRSSLGIREGEAANRLYLKVGTMAFCIYLC